MFGRSTKKNPLNKRIGRITGDKRRADRIPCNIRVSLDCGPDHVIPAVMVDKSARGARLVHSGQTLIPNKIILRGGARLGDRPARVIWRTNQELAIEYLK